MLALLAVTTEFAAAKPWKVMADCDVVGLMDNQTGGIRLASVLGNGGDVFGVVVYRRAAGVRWLLNILKDPEECMDVEAMGSMDCLKVELITKRFMLKADLAVLKAANYKPLGKGSVWPQFQSSLPGWPPWFIDQTEAEQLLGDLPRINAFCRLFCEHPDLYEGRRSGEIPFLPNPMPERPLQIADLDWRLLSIPPETIEPFKATDGQLKQLRALKLEPKVGFEYGTRLLLGSSVLEQGRPCYSRISLLVEHQNGLVVAFKLSLTNIPFAESTGTALVQTLIDAGIRPGIILIDDHRLESVLGPLCDALDMDLILSDELEFLDEANDALTRFTNTGLR